MDLTRSYLGYVVRRHRSAVATVTYATIGAVALVLAYLSRFEFDLAVLGDWDFYWALILLVPVRLTVNYALGMGLSRWRFVGIRDLLRLLAAETAGTAIVFAVTWGLPGVPTVPRSILLLEWIFNGYLTGGLWVVYRLLYERRQRFGQGPPRRTLVIGGGEAGAEVIHQVLRASSGLLPAGVVDDDPFKWGTRIHGVEIVGAVRDVVAIAKVTEADECLIAIPSATAAQLRTIVEACEGTDLPIKILPGLAVTLGDRVDVTRIRDVRVEDLLGRDPVTLELPELGAVLSGKTVLVTGAAGSIGSELVRQIAVNGPSLLVAVDQAETPLYFLEVAIRRDFPDLEFRAVIGDVTRSDTVDSVFREHRPDRVFHAAAYKHVPMMESNPIESTRTNVIGTYLVGEAAGRCGVETFVLVSTDKAVDPANVMGATKQLAERVIVELQDEFPNSAYGAVRFGNVLESNGSVIPLFRQQLERGDALTVTHADVSRFFMTIPEAVQLILQASLVPDLRGCVAMLDMGQPIRILDLARDLLRLSGHPFRPGENVIITGLRPGEKLHEELVAEDEHVVPTDTARVHLVRGAASRPLPAAVRDALETLNGSALTEWVLSGIGRNGLELPAPTDVTTLEPASRS